MPTINSRLRLFIERRCVHRLRCRRVGRHQISFEPGLRSDSRLCEARTTNTAKRENCGYDMETWQYLPNKRNKRSETQEFPGFVRGLAEGVVSKLQFATLPTTSLAPPSQLAKTDQSAMIVYPSVKSGRSLLRNVRRGKERVKAYGSWAVFLQASGCTLQELQEGGSTSNQC